MDDQRDYTEELANEADMAREQAFELAAVAGERLSGGWRVVDLGGGKWAAVHTRRGFVGTYSSRHTALDVAHHHRRDARVTRGGSVADAFHA